jgi:hypothetical protein
VLAERDYRLFMLGYSASLAGSAMVPVALTFAVLNEGHGTADVGYVLAAETVPSSRCCWSGGWLPTGSGGAQPCSPRMPVVW